MVHRLLPRAVCAAAVLGSVAALGVTAVPAAAQAVGGSAQPAASLAGTAGTPGWRIVRQFGPATSTTGLSAMTATGPADAWAVGGSCGGCQVSKLLVERWNGRSWRKVSLPAAITDNFSSDAISASSASNAWMFGSSLGTNGPVTLRWNGKVWTTSKLPSWVERINPAGDDSDVPAVFGPSNVWNFSLGALRNPALAAHFNGHAWRKVALPGEPDAVSALAANDIWAAGPSRKTMNSVHRVNIAMHWNGHSWHSVPFPRVRFRSPAEGFVSGLVALGPRDVWAGMPTGGTVSRTSGLLLHWDGKRWHRVAAPRGVFNFPTGAPVAQDGHGGLWMQANGPKAPFPLFLYHYSNGRFTRQRIGINLNLDAFAWIPRTRSVWAVGEASNAQATELQALIAKDGR